MPHCKTFDWSALLDKLGGDEEFVKSLLAVALRSSGPLPGELRAACAQADLPALARLAHKVKGTAGDIVAEPLRERARVAEMAAREGAADAVGLNLQLADAVDEFLEELRAVT